MEPLILKKNYLYGQISKKNFLFDFTLPQKIFKGTLGLTSILSSNLQNFEIFRQKLRDLIIK